MAVWSSECGLINMGLNMDENSDSQYVGRLNVVIKHL